VALSLLIFLYFVLFGREILHLFGDGFTKGTPWLIILSAGHLLNSASGPATATLIMAGYPRIVMMNSIVMGLMLIGANALLIPLYGPVGAAWAMSLHVAAGSLLSVVEARYFCRVIPYSRGMVKSLCAGAAALAVGLSLRSELVPYSTVVEGLAVTAVFGAALLVMKLEAEDREAVRGLALKFRPLARRFARPVP
jgi:O-antigen/teichoic acid export membrane protein